MKNSVQPKEKVQIFESQRIDLIEVKNFLEFNHSKDIFDKLTHTENKNNRITRLFDTSKHSSEYYYDNITEGKKPIIFDFKNDKSWYALTAYQEAHKLEWKDAVIQLGKEYGYIPLDYDNQSKANFNYKPTKVITKKEIEAKKYSCTNLVFYDDFSDTQKEYWIQVGITQHYLDKAKIKPLKSFGIINTDTGEINLKCPETAFAFDLGEDIYKIYQPFENKAKKWSVANQNGIVKEYPKPIYFLEHLPTDCKKILIVEGLKDCLSANALLNHLDIYAIGLDTASSDIEPIMNDLKSKSKDIIFCLDNDATGIKYNESNSLRFGLPYLPYPENFKDCKDFSDLILKHSKDDVTKWVLDNQTKQSTDHLPKNNTMSGPSPTEQAQLKHQNSKSEVSQLKDVYEDTPFLPDSFYQTLPKFLKECCNVFPNKREKDVFLTACLSTLTGCFNIKGSYHSSTVYSNLNIFIVANASEGKGVMKYAEVLVSAIHRSIKESSDEAKKEYDAKLRVYNQNQRKKNADPNELPPEKEPYRILLLPSNNSSAGVMQLLNDNQGKGIFFESEADVLSQTFKSDFGNYSTLIRKATHHERVTQYRKGNGGELIELEEPKLSVCLSGTPDQVINLISTTEDGLFSRFIFYSFKNELKWRSPRPTEKANYTDFFNDKSFEFKHIVETQKDVLGFSLTSSQWDKLDTSFDIWLKHFYQLNEQTSPTVKRLGLYCYRIAMLFSVLRAYEQGKRSANIVCEDIDFNNALSLVGVYVEHALNVLETLPNKSLKIKNSYLDFYESMPNTWNRAEGIAKAKSFGIGKKSYDYRLIKRLIDAKLIDKDDRGICYKLPSDDKSE